MPKIKHEETGSAGNFRQNCLRWLGHRRTPLVVCGLAFLVYSRSLFCGFVRDDLPQIVRNPQVQSWEYLPQLLGSHLWSQKHDESVYFYRPLFSLWMLLVHTLGGLSPWFWHFSSILLHLAAVWLVFQLCRRLTGNDPASAAAAAIFAVQPVHVDAVSWVSASCEVLFTIFALAAMLVLFPTRETKERQAAPRIWLSAILFGAGLFAKETALVMLAILPVIAWFRLKDRAAGPLRVWKASYPCGAIAAGYLLIRGAVLQRVGVEAGEHSWSEVFFSAPSILVFYLKKLFLPFNLAGSYVNALIGSPTAAFWMESAILVVAAGAVIWFAVRYRSLTGLGAVLIVVVPILPALAVTRIYLQGDMTHDRYLYLPSVGVSVLAALLIRKSWSFQKSARIAALALVGAAIAALSAGAISQQKYYQDDIAFYSRVIEVSPADSFAMGMLGNVYLDRGQNDLALEQFRKAHAVDPQDRRVVFFLARGLFVSGKSQEAESLLKNLLQNPDLKKNERESALVSLGNVEISLGNLIDAQDFLTLARQADDRFPALHWAQGVLYQRQGLLPQALAEYQKEFEITGDELARQRSISLAGLMQSRSMGHLSGGQ